MEMRSFSEGEGLRNVRYISMHTGLVEKARNEGVRAMLSDPNMGWLLFVDGDMVFDPKALLQMVQTAYGTHPYADVLGAYCTLRGGAFLPTIDTGTGTWENWYPGSGVVEVMRTGAAFLLVKRHVVDAIQEPWFRMRVPAKPIDAMAEVDNWARIKFNGQNPFRALPNREWERLEQIAKEDPSVVNWTPLEVGEDSGFCDRAKNAGFRIFVNTDIVIGHIDATVLTWTHHKQWVDGVEAQRRYAVGLTR